MRGVIPPLPQYVFMAWCSVNAQVKGKGKVVPVLLTKHHAMKAYRGSGCTAPLIL
jgi:hypothetical protein